MVTTYTDTATARGIAKGTFQKGISTTATVLRTAQEAAVGLAVIHGSTATWPDNYTPFTNNVAVPNPTIAPTLGLVGDGSAGWVAGTYSVTYAYSTATTTSISSPGTKTTLVSPPATITIAANFTQDISMTAPGTLPVGAGSVDWYVGLLDGNGNTVRTFCFRSTGLTHIDDGSSWGGRATEPTANTINVNNLIFGRSDDESGNVPVPIPQATPTTSYSWYKIVQAVVVPNGFGNTTITNLAIAQSGIATTGLNVFYRVVTNYVQCDGTSGLPTDNLGNQTGYYPPDDLTAHTGNSANTPAGYNPLPTTPVVIANGPFTDSISGPIGPYVQLVLGVADRSTMTLGAGQLALPQVTFYYDET